MSNKVVVDASLALKWVLREDDSDLARSLLTSWNGNGVEIMVPALFAYEITNILYRQVVTNKLTYEQASFFQEGIFSLKIAFDFSHHKEISRKAMFLANRFRLPASYDAHYLALAEREQCEYWTADARLLNGLRGQLPWVRNLSDHQTDGSDAT